MKHQIISILIVYFCSTSLAFSKETAKKMQSNLETHCNSLGAISKAFAEARDSGINFQKARKQIGPILTQKKIENKRMVDSTLALTGGLAYTQKHLQAISVFSLSKYLCMSSAKKVDKKLALKYLLESAKVCQKRMEKDQKIYACMQLAYNLFIKEQGIKP